MRIGELSERSGATIATIRFYEKKGLLLPDSRSEGDYREYVRADVEAVKAILAIKQLGFSLNKISTMLSAAQSPKATAELAAIVTERLSALQSELDSHISVKSKLDSIFEKLTNGDLKNENVLGVFSEN